MNFEELSKIWNQDHKEETHIEINERLLKEVSFNTVRNSLKEIKWSSIIEIVINYIWLFFLVEFIISYFNQAQFSIPAGILIIISVFSILIESYKLILYCTANVQSSIIGAQKKLEKLKFLELFDVNSLYIVIPLFFIPFLVVFSKGIIGIDIYEFGFSMREILVATGSTFIISVIIVYFLKAFPNKELNESLDFISELREFQKEN